MAAVYLAWGCPVLEPLGRCNFKRGLFLGRIAALGMGLGVEARADVPVAEVLQTSAIEKKDWGSGLAIKHSPPVLIKFA